MKKYFIIISFIVSISILFYNVSKLICNEYILYGIDINHNVNLTASIEMDSYEFYNYSYLLDAFYDERIEAVRILTIGLLNKIPIPTLKLVYNGKEVSANVEIAKTKMTLTKLYGNYLIYNETTSEIPKYVKINNHLIPILYYPQNIAKKYNYTICVSVFVNYTSVNHFIQVVESNINFGVDHIVIYKTSCSLEMEKVLKYYQDKGIIDIITINTTIENGILKKDYYGQLWKLNDCFYRYRIISKHILITDLDEILWSENKQLKLYIKNNRNCSAFYFRQRLYHREIFNVYDRYINNVTDTDIFSYREYCELKWQRIMKYLIYNTSLVTQLFIHFVKRSLTGFKKCYVPIEVAYVRHYRRISYKHLEFCNSSFMYDNLIDDNEKEIKERVNIVKNEMNIHPSFSNNIIILGLSISKMLKEEKK